jgi:hypothetical protein
MFQAVPLVAVAVGDAEAQLSNQGVAEPRKIAVQIQYAHKTRNQIAVQNQYAHKTRDQIASTNYLRMPQNIGELSMEPQGKKSGPHLLARTTMPALWFLD